MNSLADKIKDIMRDRVELSLESLTTDYSIPIDEEFNAVIDKFFYLFEVDPSKKVLRKKQVLRFKLFVIESPKDLNLTHEEILHSLEKFSQGIAYIRFNKNKGQLLVIENLNKLTEGLKFEFGTDEVIELRSPNNLDKREFSLNHSKHFEGIFKKKFGKGIQFIVDGLPYSKKGVYLGSRKYSSLVEIKGILKGCLTKLNDGEEVDSTASDLLNELLKYHSHSGEKAKDLHKFIVAFHPEHKDTKCFFAVKEDGSREDFSYVKCLKNLSHIINK